MSENEIRKIASEYQLYELQLRDLDKRAELIQNTIRELDITKITLNAIKVKDKDGEFLSPIGSNSFIKSKFSDTNNVLIGLGADVVAEVPVEKALEELNKRKTEFQKLLLSIRSQISKVQAKYNETRSVLQSKYAELNK